MTPTLKSHIEFCRAVSNGSTYDDVKQNIEEINKSITNK